MGRTEEQGAIVTLQSKEKPAVGMAGHLLLTPGIWDLACLRSHKNGCRRRVGRRRWWRPGGILCRSMDMAFPCTAPALLGESTAGTGAASSGTQKQLKNTWHNAGNALCMDLPCVQLLVPRAFTGTGHGLGVLRAFSSPLHPLSLPVF